MILWVSFLCILLVDRAISSPVQGRKDNAYNYDVKHPAGSSRVRVRTGGDRSSQYYPSERSNFPKSDYVADASYVSPHYASPYYGPENHGHYPRNEYQEPPHRHFRGKPAYREHAYPPPSAYQQVPYQGHTQAYGRPPYAGHPGQGVVAGPFYEAPEDKIPVASYGPTHPNPQYVQQVSVDEPIPDYGPNKLEQIPVEQKPFITQQIASDEPIGHPKNVLSQQPLNEGPILVHPEPPIDQQILVDEPKEVPVILQTPLDEKPALQQVLEDIPSTKNVPVVAKDPIIQQQSHVDDVPTISQVHYMNDDEISQKAVGDVSYKPPVVQQVSDVDPPHLIGQSPYSYADKKFGGSSIQAPIGKHPSQAIYDSSIEPSFSDSDRYNPPHSYAARPKYQFVPVGPPYEKISHATEIIHGPPHSYYSHGSVPQKHIKTNYPAVKNPPILHSVKLPPPVPQSVKLPPPPPITKTVVPEVISQGQEHIDHSINPSVKLPPSVPVTKRVTPIDLPHPQEHIDTDVILTNNPQSVKLPPPSPITKTVVPVALPEAQEHVDTDLLLTNDPPVPHSVKLPPPPVTKTVLVPDAQEHLGEDLILTKTPPIPPSVKLPPPPVTKTIVPVSLPDAQEHVDADLILTKNPPVHSVKLPPPPPVTKTVIPINLPDAQEHVDGDLILTNGPPVPHSVKIPPPAPVTKTVIPVSLPDAQEHVDEGVLLVKNPPAPQSVKLPPPPITKSIPSVKLPNAQKAIDDHVLLKPNYPDSKSIKLPPPPVTKSVVPELLSHEQRPVDITLSKEIPHSVKTPPINVPVHGPPAYGKPIVHTKEPFYGHKSIGSPHAKYPSVVSHFSKPQYTNSHIPGPHSLKHPYSAPPVWQNPNPQLHLDVPLTKTSPISHGVKHPVVGPSIKHPKTVKTVGSPYGKPPHVNSHFASLPGAHEPENYPPPHLVGDPHASLDPSNYPPTYDGPVEIHPPFSHAGEPLYPVIEGGLNYGGEAGSVHFDEPSGGESFFETSPPVTHTGHLPPPELKSTPAVATKSTPASHDVLIPSQEHKPASTTGKPLVKDKAESSPTPPPKSETDSLTSTSKATAVPNLFAAVPTLPEDDDKSSKDPELPVPNSAALVSPLSHPVRHPIQGNRYNSLDKLDEPKQRFPDFPVESAFKQRDPVSEKVAELTNSYAPPGEGYPDNDYEPEDDDSSKPPSIDEAKAEIGRINSEIGFSFGERLPRRSRFPRF